LLSFNTTARLGLHRLLTRIGRREPQPPTANGHRPLATANGNPVWGGTPNFYSTRGVLGYGKPERDGTVDNQSPVDNSS
jgi:hypothetical protein